MALLVHSVLDETASRHGNLPALKVKIGGEWQTTTWSQYRDTARLVARGLISLGLEARGAVVIMGYNRPEWFMADIGAILAGGVPAGIYTTSSPDQCQYIADHCEATVAVLENSDYLKKFRAVQDQLPRLKRIVLMEGPGDGEPDVLSWEQLMQAGQGVPEAELQARLEAQKADDLCTLIYTSGTTGPPKAVMMSQDNLTWTARVVVDEVQEIGPGDSVISYLPLSHIAEQIVSLHVPMAYAGCSWFAESVEALGDTLKEVRPAAFVGVPRVWEKIQAKIVASAAGNSGLKKRIGAWARKQGLAGGYAQQHGKPLPMFHGLAEKLVFSKVREALGLDRCRLVVTTAAPTSLDTKEFFLSLGIGLCEIYGMSECAGPGTISVPRKYRTRRAGYALPGTEIKIAEDGEVCMRGRHVFLGYLKNPDATAEALDSEGWLHSGDIGTLDAEGFLQITDRKKELIITAGGKNISPQLIEGKLKAIPVVAQAVVVGDARRFLSALLTLDPERVAEEAREAGIQAGDTATAAASEAFKAHLQQQVDQVNGQLSRAESIRKFVILPEELTVETGELTPTMKLKRRVINDRYSEQIEQMYR